MEKKKKIVLIVFLVIFALDIIFTGIFGIKTNLYYGEGQVIRFQIANTTFDINDIKSITKEVFGKEYIVKKVEFFNDSALIKVKSASDEQLDKLCEKLNEKYSSSLTKDNLNVKNETNVKIRTIIEPYVIPVGISVMLILVYYAIRFKGSKEMTGYVKTLAAITIIYYGIFAICRVKFSELTMPIAISLYVLSTLIYTTKSELNTK